MDVLTALIQALGNGFFPIVVCGVLFWYVYKKDLAHKEEIAELRKSIDNNTQVVQKLLDKIEAGD